MLCYPSSSPPILTFSSCILHCLCSGHSSYSSDLWEHLVPWAAPCSNLSCSVPALHEATIVCAISYGSSGLPQPEETSAFCYPYHSLSCSYPYSCFPSLCGCVLVYQLQLFQHKPNQHGEYMPLLQPPFLSWFKAWHQIPEGFSHPTGVPPCIEECVRGGSQLLKHPSPSRGIQPWAGCSSLPPCSHTHPTAGQQDKSTAHP